MSVSELVKCVATIRLQTKFEFLYLSVPGGILNYPLLNYNNFNLRLLFPEGMPQKVHKFSLKLTFISSLKGFQFHNRHIYINSRNEMQYTYDMYAICIDVLYTKYLQRDFIFKTKHYITINIKPINSFNMPMSQIPVRDVIIQLFLQ